MPEGGFFEQKRARPGGLAIVVALHAAVLAALVLVKGPVFIAPDYPPTKVVFIPLPVDPPPIPPPPNDNERPLPPQRPTTIDLPPRPFPIPSDTPATDPTRHPSLPSLPTPSGTETIEPRVAPPVRRDAVVDPRYADALQPPYPPSEERAGREGNVRVRVTIGADGRVKSVARLSATSDAFWRVTERQALSRWRFRPATVDDRPVESSKIMTVHFEITN